MNGGTNLVVCQKSKVKDWTEHFIAHYPQLIVVDLTDKKVKHFTRDYTGQTVYIINYDLTFRRPKLLTLPIDTLMLDESSLITNPSAARTKFIHKLKPKNVILLSGTPTGGKYEKLWSQLRLLGWDISKELFYKQYVITDWIDTGAGTGFRIPVVTGYKNVERLKSKLRDHGCVFMKTEEVFDLPEKIDIPVMIHSSPEYKKFMRNSLIKLDTPSVELVGDSALNKRLYARQLCGQYSPDKLRAFENLLESTDDRLIIFYNFNEELEAMKRIAKKLEKPISYINGSVKNLLAYNLHDDSMTFVQYQAGAMGMNLQLANKVIYFTLPQSSDLFEQSKKRVHRIGQNKTCFYYYLLCESTVEEDILKTLKERKDYDDELFRKYEANTSEVSHGG